MKGGKPRLEPFFPKSHGRPWVYDRRVLGGTTFTSCAGAMVRVEPPSVRGRPEKGMRSTQDALQRLEALERDGVFARLFEGLAAEAMEPTAIMIGATYLKASRTAASLRSKNGG